MDPSWSGMLVDLQPKPFQTNKLWGILVIQELFALIIKCSLRAFLGFTLLIMLFSTVLHVPAHLTGVLLFVDYHDGVLLSLPLRLS